MQLWIEHALREPLRLPINYHHILQSMIYSNVSQEASYSSFLHDEGYAYELRKFKLFTFGPIKGKYIIDGRDIVFLEKVSFEVRSIDDFFLRTLYMNIQKNGLTYLKQYYDDISVTLENYTVEEEEIQIDMVSPVCQYRTDEETGKTYYFTPADEEFSKQINMNFRRKYKAYYGMEPESDIVIIPREISIDDKYVTKYKGFYITGWRGKYSLRGKRKYLDFLYQTGLGSKNSQGFGMFKEDTCF